MDGSERLTATELFEQACPFYMSIGMSYEEFWCGDVELVVFYRKAHELKTRRENEMMWMQGVYHLKALEATVGNLFLKKGASPNTYPTAPFPITESEHREMKAREEALRQERMKAEFARFVAQMAQKMPTEAHPRSKWGE